MAVSMIPNVTLELLLHAALVTDEIWVIWLNQLVRIQEENTNFRNEPVDK